MGKQLGNERSSCTVSTNYKYSRSPILESNKDLYLVIQPGGDFGKDDCKVRVGRLTVACTQRIG